MEEATLFVIFLCATSLTAIYMVLYSMKNRAWVNHVAYITLGFVWIYTARMMLVYLYVNNAYNYISFFYWCLYFSEHFIEAVLWSTLSTMVQVRKGKKIDNKDNIIETVLRMSIFIFLFCILVMITLLLSDNIDKTVKVLRQVTFMLTICSATMEFLFVVAKSIIFEDDAGNMFKNSQSLLLMVIPTVMLFISLMVCGIPKMIQGCTCYYLESAYMTIISAIIAGIWYYIAAINCKCKVPGGKDCPSQFNDPIVLDNASGDILGCTSGQKCTL